MIKHGKLVHEREHYITHIVRVHIVRSILLVMQTHSWHGHRSPMLCVWMPLHVLLRWYDADKHCLITIRILLWPIMREVLLDYTYAYTHSSVLQSFVDIPLKNPCLQSFCKKHCVDLYKSTQCFKSQHYLDLCCSQVHTSYVALKQVLEQNVQWHLKFKNKLCKSWAS